MKKLAIALLFLPILSSAAQTPCPFAALADKESIVHAEKLTISLERTGADNETWQIVIDELKTLCHEFVQRLDEYDDITGVTLSVEASITEDHDKCGCSAPKPKPKPQPAPQPQQAQ